jgi:ABC-2 type transport system ATP-binding protein
MPASPVIQTQGLSRSFKEVAALKPLDLSVPANSIFGFLGPNGAGKTTTMKLLLGLIRPSAGSAQVFDLDIVRDSVKIRSRIGYLPQDPRFYEHMTARQTMDFTARFFFKGPESEIRKRVGETLDLVGLSDKADRKVKTFSGGERQRLEIAQAQVNYPDLLILDEPAASLDPLGRRDVLEVMERLRKHTTIFYSTHILNDVQHVSDTVAILNKGELVAYGSIQELLAGTSGIVYTLTLESAAADALETARRSLAAQPWVVEVNSLPGSNGAQTWMVSVNDEALARQRLLRLVLEQDGVTVTQFGRKQYELAEVFMNIVEGGGHGGK